MNRYTLSVYFTVISFYLFFVYSILFFCIYLSVILVFVRIQGVQGYIWKTLLFIVSIFEKIHFLEYPFFEIPLLFLFVFLKQ
jgi:hypothetical protein